MNDLPNRSSAETPDPPKLTPAEEADSGRLGTGMERPEALPPSGPRPYVERTFAFVDLSSFTAFCERHGEGAAVQVLAEFRVTTSEVAARRGVRVAKWLGDGAMLVGVRPGPVVATAAELLGRFDLADLRVGAGIAGGPVMLFAGDDYIGRAVNLAARLSDLAAPGEILAEESAAQHAPPWVEVRSWRSIEVRGAGTRRVAVLGLAPDVRLPGAAISRAEVD